MRNTEPHFFDMLDDLIVVLTPASRIVFANKAMQHKLGCTNSALLSMSVMDLHAPSDRATAAAILAAILRGEQKKCPLPLVTKAGLALPVETQGWIGQWEGERCIFGVSKDISAEREAKQRFELLFRNSPSPMALTTLPDRRFVDVNDFFLRLLKFSKDELMGRTSAELRLFPKDSVRAMIAQQLHEKGRVSDTEVQVRAKDGTIGIGSEFGHGSLFWVTLPAAHSC